MRELNVGKRNMHHSKLKIKVKVGIGLEAYLVYNIMTMVLIEPINYQVDLRGVIEIDLLENTIRRLASYMQCAIYTQCMLISKSYAHSCNVRGICRS